MRITRNQLRRIINEEMRRLIDEQGDPVDHNTGTHKVTWTEEGLMMEPAESDCMSEDDAYRYSGRIRRGQTYTDESGENAVRDSVKVVRCTGGS
jgi:hypothetical protein